MKPQAFVKSLRVNWTHPEWSLGLAGLAAFALQALFDLPRLWANALLLTYLLLGLGLAATLFLAFHVLTAARWSEPLLPVPRTLALTVPAAAVLFLLVLLTGLGNYPWWHAHTFKPAEWFKATWLKPTFFLARSVVYLVLWSVFSLLLARLTQNGGSRRSTTKLLAALFVVVFGFTVWLASTDWVMSLEPEWYSTVFGVYHFAGIFLSGLALLTLVGAVLFRLQPRPGLVTESRLHDLGKLLFGFSSFWMYIWFCQYMLIWYTDIPEETVYFVRRVQGLWHPLFLLNAAVNWGVPFAVLATRKAKRNPAVLIQVCVVVLLGRWLDLYLSLVPPLSEGPPPFGFAELGSLFLAVAVLGGTVRLLRQQLGPVGAGSAAASASAVLEADVAGRETASASEPASVR